MEVEINRVRKQAQEVLKKVRESMKNHYDKKKEIEREFEEGVMRLQQSCHLPADEDNKVASLVR